MITLNYFLNKAQCFYAVTSKNSMFDCSGMNCQSKAKDELSQAKIQCLIVQGRIQFRDELFKAGLVLTMR